MLSSKYIKRAASIWLLFFVFTSAAMAQNAEKVYKIVYEMPEFKGGMDSLGIYLRDNVKYPYEDRLNKVEGVVFISFVIENDGSISTIKVDEKASKGATEAMKEEAIRVVEAMPNWKPGKFDDGTTARVSHELPIGFRMGAPKNKRRR